MTDTPKEEALELKEDPSQQEGAVDAAIAAQEGQVEDAFATLKADLSTLQERYVRLAAEFDNYKKREQREKEVTLKYANERLLTELLPVLDNLDHAVSAAQAGSSDDPLLKTLQTGVQMVLKQFVDTLDRMGVQQFSAKGQAFDPARHEAMGEIERKDMPVGSVVEEFQKGYTLHGRLIRPARVMIAKAPLGVESEVS